MGEQATVTGLLSTLNEDAQEDILLEEINNARTEAENAMSEDRVSEIDEEADVLYYSNPSASTQNLDIVSDPQHHDLEKGKKSRRDAEMVWSTMSSRRGSRHGSLSVDIDAPPVAGCTSTSTSEDPRKSSKKPKKKKDFVDRAKTAISLNRNSTAIDEDEDPYAWLSKTAPPSPGYVNKSKTLPTPGQDKSRS